MNHIRRIPVAVCMLLLMSIAYVQAQNAYTLLSPERIATMLIEEKKTGMVDNAPFAAFLDSLGFKKGERIGRDDYVYEKQAVDRDGEKKVSIQVALNHWHYHKFYDREIIIRWRDSSAAWYFFVELKRFGIWGPNNKGEGKGLKSYCHRYDQDYYVVIGYDFKSTLKDNNNEKVKSSKG